jgi:hypothetical protein
MKFRMIDRRRLIAADHRFQEIHRRNQSKGNVAAAREKSGWSHAQSACFSAMALLEYFERDFLNLAGELEPALLFATRIKRNAGHNAPPWHSTS